MDTKLIIGAIVVIVIIIGVALVAGGAFNKPEKITIVGSTSVQPVAEKLAAQYHKEHPNVNITVQGGGSSVGLKSVQDGTANIGTYSSKLKDSDKAGITEYQIASDGVVVVVNTASNLTDLTINQTKDIFAGKNSTLTVVTREEGSGTRDAFISLIMGGKNGTNITKSAIVQSSTDAIKQAVKGNPNAIGYMSLADVDSSVKVLKIGGVTPSEATIKDGTYTVQRPFLFLTKGNATGATLDFINWCLSPAGQKIVQESGAVPVKPTS
jgi:phosphate transport system substrate-binding protein